MRKILVPLDGSTRAETVLHVAAAFACATGQELLLLQVAAASQRGHTPAQRDEATHAGDPDYLTRVADRVRVGGPRVTPAAGVRPAAHLVEFVRREPLISAIAATVSGCGPAQQTLGGAVEDLLRPADVPLLLVHEDQAPPPLARDATIIVPFDASACARQALHEAESIAAATGARLLLVTVLPQAEQPTGAPSISWADQVRRQRTTYLQQQLEQSAREISASGLPASAEVLYGQPAEEISRLAGKHGVALIVMASQGQTADLPFRWGHVTHGVIGHSPVPILLRSPSRARNMFLVES